MTFSDNGLELWTPTPWRVEQRKHENVILHSEGDGYNNRVAKTVQWSPASKPRITPDKAKANAARIVACVNACEGLATESFTQGSVAELVSAARALLHNGLVDAAATCCAGPLGDELAYRAKALSAALAAFGEKP